VGSFVSVLGYVIRTTSSAQPNTHSIRLGELLLHGSTVINWVNVIAFLFVPFTCLLPNYLAAAHVYIYSPSLFSSAALPR
jgi:hypothetical protein